MNMDARRCREFDAIMSPTTGDAFDLRVTGEVECPAGGYQVELQPHASQGFNELDLLVGLVVTPPPGKGNRLAADEPTWTPADYRMTTTTRYTTVTITDCGATIPVRDATA